MSEECAATVAEQPMKIINGRRQRELEVIISELKSIKKGASVYSQQPNSNVYFLTTREEALQHAQTELSKLKDSQQSTKS
jgi:hypothetical protein